MKLSELRDLLERIGNAAESRDPEVVVAHGGTRLSFDGRVRMTLGETAPVELCVEGQEAIRSAVGQGVEPARRPVGKPVVR